MASLFARTGQRRFWGFVALWGVAITSIVLRATTRPGDGILSHLHVVGAFYHRAWLILDEFARLTTVPVWVPLLAYALIGVVLVGIAVFVLGAAVGESTFTLLFQLYLTTVALAFSGTVLFATLAFVPFFGVTPGGVVSFVLVLTPKIIPLALIGLAISFVTNAIP